MDSVMPSVFPSEVAPKGLLDQQISVGKYLGIGTQGVVTMLVRVSAVEGKNIYGYSLTAKAKFRLCEDTCTLHLQCNDSDTVILRGFSVLYTGRIPANLNGVDSDAAISYMREQVAQESAQKATKKRPPAKGFFARLFSFLD